MRKAWIESAGLRATDYWYAASGQLLGGGGLVVSVVSVV